MRRVRKGPEPTYLAELRRDVKRIEHETGSPINDLWKEVKNKDEIQGALIRDQDGLCVYCGAQIRRDTMKIEHFVARSASRAHILDWNNLLGCCMGQYKEDEGWVRHCDTHRTEYAPGPPERGYLNTHPVGSPRDPETLFVVNITAKGTDLGVVVATTDSAQHDLDELNLNAARLVENRARVVRVLRVELAKVKDPERPKVCSRRFRAATTPASEGLPPYAHVAAAYLKRKLKQYGIKP